MKVILLCPTLCNPRDYTVHGLFQAKILEWVAISFSRGSSQLRDQTQVSSITERLFTIWTTREFPKGVINKSKILCPYIRLTGRSTKRTRRRWTKCSFFLSHLSLHLFPEAGGQWQFGWGGEIHSLLCGGAGDPVRWALHSLILHCYSETTQGPKRLTSQNRHGLCVCVCRVELRGSKEEPSPVAFLGAFYRLAWW